MLSSIENGVVVSCLNHEERPISRLFQRVWRIFEYEDIERGTRAGVQTLFFILAILAILVFGGLPARGQVSGTSGSFGTLTVSGTASINALDVSGNSAIFGAWSTNSLVQGVTFIYSEATGGTNASYATTLTRSVSNWNWLRLDGSGNSWAVMALDQSNQLVLTGTQTSGPGSIIIDPTVGQITINGNQVLANSSSLFVSGSGMIGIGTTSPTQPLDVNGNTYIQAGTLGVGAAPVANIAVFNAHYYGGSSSNVYGFYDATTIGNYNFEYDGYFSDITYNGATTIPRVSAFRMGNPHGTGTMATVSAFYLDALTGGVINYGMFLNNAPNGGSIASAPLTNITLMPGAGGDVGINNTSPQATLDVTGSNTGLLRMTSTGTMGASGGAGISTFTSTIPTATGQRLGFYTFGANDSGSNRNSVALAAYSSQPWVSGSAWGGYLTFMVTQNNATSRIEAMRIAQNGYLGINTTSPQKTLDVNGGAYVRGGLVVTGSNAGGTYVASGTNFVLIPQEGDISMGTFTVGAVPQ